MVYIQRCTRNICKLIDSGLPVNIFVELLHKDWKNKMNPFLVEQLKTYKTYREITDVDMYINCIKCRFYMYSTALMYQYHKIFNSLFYDGYIIYLFNTVDPSYVTKLIEWFKLIGCSYSKEAINRIQNDYKIITVYKNNITGIEAQRICQYCEEMFGIDRKEVAGHMEKTDILSVLWDMTQTKYKKLISYYYRVIAGIFLENGNYNKAIKMLYKSKVFYTNNLIDHYNEKIVQRYSKKGETVFIFDFEYKLIKG